MAKRAINRLIATQLNKLAPGMHPDGGGLWLQVSPAGTRSWSFRFTLHGKSREMGLGPLITISLAEARTAALEARKQLLDGVDPIEHRKAARVAAALAAASAKTFKECAEAYIAAHKAGWSKVHAAQWPSTMATYVYPVFGDMPVQAVNRDLVLKVLAPIWTTKTETASRVRGRIERILDWARAEGFRTGENPARLRGNLDHSLAKQSKVQTVENHPALAHAAMPGFMSTLDRRNSTSAQALKLTILTASRTSEVRLAEWSEFDLKARLWTRPAKRMKGRKEHSVPLSDAAMAVLEAVKGLDTKFVFPGGKKETPLSNMAMSEFLKGVNGDPAKYVDRRSGRPITVHGFRSTFRDWASEETNFPHEVCEMALAHVIGNKAEAAYRRGELLAKRRELMDAWSKYCASAPPAAKDSDDAAAEIAAQVRRETGKPINEAARIAVDCMNAVYDDFHDVDLGHGPAIAPPAHVDGSTPLHRDQLDPETAREELERRQRRHVVDEQTPPLQLETRLHANDAVVRRIARKAEKLAANVGRSSAE